MIRFIIGIIGAIILCRSAFSIYVLTKDVSAYVDRAQVAADAGDMHQYLQQAESGMQKHDLTTGHVRLYFKTANSDLAIIHQSVKRLNERLVEVRRMDTTEFTYQAALDDIRGTIRELDIPVGSAVWVKDWWLIIVGGICFFIGFGTHLLSSEENLWAY